MAFDETITFRLEHDAKELMIERARCAGMTPADWLRNLVDSELSEGADGSVRMAPVERRLCDLNKSITRLSAEISKVKKTVMALNDAVEESSSTADGIQTHCNDTQRYVHGIWNKLLEVERALPSTIEVSARAALESVIAEESTQEWN